MKEAHKLKLLKKGWRETEIKKAEAFLEQSAQHDVYLSKIVFWSALVVIIFANILISLVLIPFLIVIYSWFLYFIILLLGGTIGFLYRFLITDIGHLQKKHHLLAGIIVPLLALINLAAVVLISNRFIADLKLNNLPHNPWVIGIVFAAAFILPTIISKIWKLNI